jgi:beta-1,2-mannobiose phosphorylase / 1,2-beta-oligomannan phosphorylase
MTDLARRFADNPIVSPEDVVPTRPGLYVLGVFNPAAFRFQGKTWLLMRVAEGVPAGSRGVSAPILAPDAPHGMRVVEVADGDPDLVNDDPRVFIWRGRSYLTTISHLRLASYDERGTLHVEPGPALEGQGDLECYGVEDCRVSEIDGRYHLTYSAVSPDGCGVALASTADWQSFERNDMILAPPNKDCVLFPARIGGQYVALHRPVSEGLGGKFIWIARSPDLAHWGEHRCLVRTRPGAWDSVKVGAGAPPVRIAEGWLELYHGVTEDGAYRMGAVLLDAEDPLRILGRSRQPIMEPLADHERRGFFGNVVFGTGALVDGDELTLYYGAADQWVCAARFSVAEILAGLA